MIISNYNAASNEYVLVLSFVVAHLFNKRLANGDEPVLGIGLTSVSPPTVKLFNAGSMVGV